MPRFAPTWDHRHRKNGTRSPQANRSRRSAAERPGTPAATATQVNGPAGWVPAPAPTTMAKAPQSGIPRPCAEQFCALYAAPKRDRPAPRPRRRPRPHPHPIPVRSRPPYPRRGAVGVALGAAATGIYATAKGWAIVIPALAWGGGLAAALLIGAAAGLWPALRAARLSPTEALWSI